MDQSTCMICEQGDLGLFADPITAEEQKALDEQTAQKETNSESN